MTDRNHRDARLDAVDVVPGHIAVRGAQDLAKETAASEMKKLTAGMGLPPGMGF